MQHITITKSNIGQLINNAAVVKLFPFFKKYGPKLATRASCCRQKIVEDKRKNDLIIGILQGIVTSSQENKLKLKKALSADKLTIVVQGKEFNI